MTNTDNEEYYGELRVNQISERRYGVSMELRLSPYIRVKCDEEIKPSYCVLTRRPKESVFLVDTRNDQTLGEIKIVLLSEYSYGARLGFEFPRYIEVLRDNAKNKGVDINGNR